MCSNKQKASCSMSFGLPCVLFSVHPVRGEMPSSAAESKWLSTGRATLLCFLHGHVTRSGAFTWISHTIGLHNISLSYRYRGITIHNMNIVNLNNIVIYPPGKIQPISLTLSPISLSISPISLPILLPILWHFAFSTLRISE